MEETKMTTPMKLIFSGRVCIAIGAMLVSVGTLLHRIQLEPESLTFNQTSFDL